jgi:hypothetical protein
MSGFQPHRRNQRRGKWPTTVGNCFWKQPHDCGIRVVFGYPGSGSMDSDARISPRCGLHARCPRLFDGRGSNDKGSRLCVPRSHSGAIPAPTPNYPHFLHSRRGRHFTIPPSDAWIVKSLGALSRNSCPEAGPGATPTARLYGSTSNAHFIADCILGGNRGAGERVQSPAAPAAPAAAYDAATVAAAATTADGSSPGPIAAADSAAVILTRTNI